MLAGLKMPGTMSYRLQGQSRILDETTANLIMAICLAMIFVYMVLASQFESFLQPIVIMLALPIAVPFALFTLWATGRTLNLWSALGMLLLLGIVKKNSILQVDYANVLRARGLPIREAIVESCRTRLRPILMTTTAIIAGLIPTSLGIGIGGTGRAAIAVTIIGGQSLCLLLTLLLVPVAYVKFDEFERAFDRRGRQGVARPGFRGDGRPLPAGHGDRLVSMRHNTLMTLRSRIRLLLPILAFTSVVSFTGAQQPAATIDLKNAPLDLTIPVDPLITVGTLPNGLRYYVRENRLPQARAELRLVVKAGSVLEDEDQRGLAHFVEHMAFNGTRHFPKQEISTFMQALGMRFGAHVNAHTSFDETVYELQIPTGNPAVMDRSLTILEDFAQNVSFDAVEIDKERGVILEEWRLGLGAGERIRDAQMPVLLKGSRYAERSPIGKPEIIRSANYDRLKQFYADWYRPDMMAVVAVGDFRQGGGRSANTIPLWRDSGRGVSEAEARLHRTGPTRNGLLDHHRSRSDANGHQCLHQDARSRPIDGRRVPQADGRAVVQRHVVGPFRRDRATAERAVSRGPDQPRHFRADRRVDVAECACRAGRRRARAHGAVHRNRPRGAVRFHRDRARSAGARSAAGAGERGGGEEQEPVGPAGRRVHQELSAGRADSGHRVPVRVEPAFPPRDHACRNQCAREGMGARSQPRRGNHRAGKRQSDRA